MRVLVDPETGEVVEAVPEAVLGPQSPYDYADFRRANLAQTREHRQALRDLHDAEHRAAKADAAYRRELAKGMLLAKAAHGATAAEHLAKGMPEVVKAYEARLIGESDARVAMEKVRLCRDDAQRLAAMGYWSREANADGWRDT